MGHHRAHPPAPRQAGQQVGHRHGPCMAGVPLDAGPPSKWPALFSDPALPPLQVLLSLPLAVFYAYQLALQTYVLRLDLIISRCGSDVIAAAAVVASRSGRNGASTTVSSIAFNACPPPQHLPHIPGVPAPLLDSHDSRHLHPIRAARGANRQAAPLQAQPGGVERHKRPSPRQCRCHALCISHPTTP